MNTIPSENGTRTLETPDAGIGTPKKPISNIVFIYGHSRWQGKISPFSQIPNLAKGDKIFIENKKGQEFAYEVQEFKAYNYNDPRFNLDTPPDGSLVLQTTAVYNGYWLVDRNKAIENLGEAAVEKFSDHVAYQVISTRD